MNKLDTFKKILLVAIAFLVVVFSIQLFFEKNSSFRVLSVKGIDTLDVTKIDGTAFTLTKKNNEWILKDNPSEPLNQNTVNLLIEAVSTLRVLGTLSSDTDVSRFGFADGQNLILKAYSKNKLIRTITVGKQATIPSQNYLRLGNAKEVLLVAKDFLSLFNIDPESLILQKIDEQQTQSSDEFNSLQF